MKHDQQKQYKLIDAISKKIFQVLEESQIKLRESGYVPGMPFPSDSKIRDALSLCLENTAFLSEILLHMPDITHEFLKAEKSRTESFRAGCGQSFEIVLDLIWASQELSISERDPDYVNPYKSKKSDAFALKEKPLKKKERKKKTFKKGPRLSSQFGDL
ncbi:Coiled-coil domain-containing protein [Armadillidium vulgare]|nr:Coiled-coil domain-containing protein [Armadillidium vulgare]